MPANLSNKMPPRPPGPVVQLRPANVYGNVPFQMPLYTMPAISRYVLRHDQVDYDQSGALEQDAAFIGDLERQGGLLGLGARPKVRATRTKTPGQCPAGWTWDPRGVCTQPIGGEIGPSVSPPSSIGAEPPYPLPTVSPMPGQGVTPLLTTNMNTTVSALPSVPSYTGPIGSWNPFGPPPEQLTAKEAEQWRKLQAQLEAVKGQMEPLRSGVGTDKRISREFMKLGQRAAQLSRALAMLARRAQERARKAKVKAMRGLSEYPGPNTPRYYLDGLGAVKKKAVAPKEPQTVSVGVTPPIKGSTMALVIGAAGVVVLGSVALWAYKRTKGK